MPSRLVLQFLGLPQLYLDTQPIATDRRKAIALLAYLAVNDIGSAHQRYSRESLSALLWPDYEQAKAFSNLRRTIWEVHQAIGESWLIADRESVQLNPDAEIDLDVAHFQNLLSQSSQQSDPTLRISLLSDAVKIYRNHFLTGFSLKDAYAFNEWAYAEAEELQRQLVDALAFLAEHYCGLGQASEAIPYARRLVSLDPLNEFAHRQLMEIYIRAGQHGAALKQYQTCEQILRKELNLDPQPETRALYKKIRKGEIKPVRVEKPKETITPKHNLPLQLSTFIGREKEQGEIVRLLEKYRLVTLTGVGGIGKTRLALQVGQRLLNDYRDGVWFVPLDSLSDPTLVPQTVASTFDIREGPDRPVIEILMNVLRGRTALLILDNCEHLLDSCAELITSLLTNCSNLKILVTSRETLNMEGEAVYYLPTLSLPENDNLVLENMTEYESVRLFTERATLALSSFQLTTENARIIVNICRKVDGIPLAIELAAARVNILQLKEILKQLNDSFALLVSDGRRILPRHQTLQTSMDWSWGLLTEAEQRFLRQLSVFAGGWTLESAQAVCDGNVLDLTSALVQKSLIIANQESGRETRYRFHEIVRQYAREKLIEVGEEETIRTRHLGYFLEFSKHAELALKGPKYVEWLERLNDERNNIRSALEWADKTNVEAGLYISGRLERVWEIFDVREGARWLNSFIENPESKAYPLARARALVTQGWLWQWLQQFDLLISVAQECLQLYRTCGDQHGEVDALVLFSATLDIPQAMELLSRALSLSQVLKDRWRQAYILAEMGSLAIDYQRSRSYKKEAINLFREARDWRSLAGNLGNLAQLEMLNGDLESAQKSLDEAIALNESLNNKALRGRFFGIAGLMAFIKGDYERAWDNLQEAVTTADEFGHRMFYLWWHVRLGYAALKAGKITEARDIFAENVQDFQTHQNVIGVVFSAEGMSGLYITVGKPDIAARLIGWADAMRKKIGDTRPLLEQAEVDKLIAACLAQMGEVAFSDAYDEGQKMSLDEAVAYALHEK